MPIYSGNIPRLQWLRMSSLLHCHVARTYNTMRKRMKQTFSPNKQRNDERCSENAKSRLLIGT